MSIIHIPGLESTFGGKGASGTYQTIINQIVPHHVYIEPFLRSGRILRHKKPAEFLNWGMDIDPNIIKYWDNIDLPPLYKISNGCAILLLKSIADGKLFELVLNNAFHIKDFTTYLYLDPPYRLKTRKSSKKQYSFELSDYQHEEILNYITSINGEYSTNIYIGISCLANDEMYSKRLKDWRYIEFYNQTRKGKQLERLYMNYREPEILHQYNYLGKDYREREKIQNQIKRNVQRLERMPPILRNAIITNINERF